MSTQAAADMQQSLQMQRQEILTTLRNHPASGRLVINISSDISKWENTPADIELRAGDILFIPKRPDFVTVSGQVYNQVAISYVPRRDLDWYLQQSGGATQSGDKKRIYVLHADGSVVVPRDRESIWMGNRFMSLRMRPGDTIIVPEKIIGGSPVWQNIMGIAQIMSATTLPLAIGGVI
jgi:protein involved in polysaccharide export with SLBB domain